MYFEHPQHGYFEAVGEEEPGGAIFLPLEPCRSMHADQALRGVLSHSRVHSGRFRIYKSEKTLVHFMPGNPFQWSKD